MDADGDATVTFSEWSDFIRIIIELDHKSAMTDANIQTTHRLVDAATSDRFWDYEWPAPEIIEHEYRYVPTVVEPPPVPVVRYVEPEPVRYI